MILLSYSLCACWNEMIPFTQKLFGVSFFVVCLPYFCTALLNNQRCQPCNTPTPNPNPTSNVSHTNVYSLLIWINATVPKCNPTIIFLDSLSSAHNFMVTRNCLHTQFWCSTRKDEVNLEQMSPQLNCKTTGSLHV